jgi:hypothetical protein
MGGRVGGLVTWVFMGRGREMSFGDDVMTLWRFRTFGCGFARVLSTSRAGNFLLLCTYPFFLVLVCNTRICTQWLA